MLQRRRILFLVQSQGAKFEIGIRKRGLAVALLCDFQLFIQRMLRRGVLALATISATDLRQALTGNTRVVFLLKVLKRLLHYAQAFVDAQGLNVQTTEVSQSSMFYQLSFIRAGNLNCLFPILLRFRKIAFSRESIAKLEQTARGEILELLLLADNSLPVAHSFRLPRTSHAFEWR